MGTGGEHLGIMGMTASNVSAVELMYCADGNILCREPNERALLDLADTLSIKVT